MHFSVLRGKLAEWHLGAQAQREPYLAALHIAFQLDHAAWFSKQRCLKRYRRLATLPAGLLGGLQSIS